MDSVNASLKISPSVDSYTTNCSTSHSHLPVTNIHNLTNLPKEVIVKIASNLFPKDYGNFRLSCKAFSTINPSFGVMGQALEDNTCNGSLKKNYQRNLYGNLKILWQQRTGHIESAMKNISIKTNSSGSEKYTIMQVSFFPVDQGEKNYIGSWITENFYYSLSKYYAPSSQVAFLSINQSEKLVHFSINFHNCLLDDSTIHPIFYLANFLCEDIKTPEQMVIFSMINKLKNYWYENPLDNVNKEKILELSENYPRLFKRNYLLQLISYKLSTQE